MITIDKIFILNTGALSYLESFSAPDIGDFSAFNCKNNHYEKVIGYVNSYCSQVLESMMGSIVHLFKYQYIDIKVHNLKLGENPANGLWHLDSSLNPLDEYDNYLFVSGSHNTTEFITNKIEICEHISAKEFSDDIQGRSMLHIEKIRPNTIVKYSGNNVHRSPFCEIPEKRMLIRLVNTDKILPQSQIKWNHDF